MKTWLEGEHKYVRVNIEPKLRKQLETSGSYTDVQRLLFRQITDALGGEPISMKWEQEEEKIVIGAAI